MVLGDSGAELARMWLWGFRQGQLPLLLQVAHAMHMRVSSTDKNMGHHTMPQARHTHMSGQFAL